MSNLYNVNLIQFQDGMVTNICDINTPKPNCISFSTNIKSLTNELNTKITTLETNLFQPLLNVGNTKINLLSGLTDYIDSKTPSSINDSFDFKLASMLCVDKVDIGLNSLVFPDVKYNVSGTGLTIDPSMCLSNKLVIPSEIYYSDYSSKKLINSTFNLSSNVSTMYLPPNIINYVTSINTTLKNIHFHPDTTYIPPGFSNLAGITSVTLPTGLLSISPGTFGVNQKIYLNPENISSNVCKNLVDNDLYDNSNNSQYTKRTTVSAGLNKVIDSVGWTYYVDGDSKATVIDCPSTISTVGDTEPASFVKKNNYIIPVSVFQIDYPNDSKTQLTALKLSSVVTKIGQTGLYYKTSLTSLTLPNNLREIESRAFGSNNYASIMIPNSVTKIGSEVFSNCRNLVSITLPSGLTCIQKNMFSGCALSDATFSIPRNIKKIKKGAFQSCQFTNVTIPDSVTKIGAEAFRHNKLTSLKLHHLLSSATVVGNNAFTMTSLKSVSYYYGMSMSSTDRSRIFGTRHTAISFTEYSNVF